MLTLWLMDVMYIIQCKICIRVNNKLCVIEANQTEYVRETKVLPITVNTSNV